MGNKLMMKLFIGSEAFFFLSLMVAYVVFWNQAGFGAEALHYLDLRSGAAFTFLLITSSFSFWTAERSFNSVKYKKAWWWLLATVILGLAFLFGQAHEFYSLFKEDLTLSKSEFGTSFYTLAGFHGLHVVLGVIFLGILAGITAGGNFRKIHSSLIGTAGIYWHFVDAVWLAVFSLIYILPYFVKL